MELNNDMQLRIYAEGYIRARLLEAENHQMLNQLRGHYQSGISLRYHTMLGRLGRLLIALGERLVCCMASIVHDLKAKVGLAKHAEIVS